jgi:6-phosphogluconolactonase
MELVGAPVSELKSVLTSSFEEWAHLREGSGGQAGTAGSASCALSGGATALIFLSALINANVDWRKITLFWADERAVPVDDADSNYGLAERMLLSPLGARAPRAIRMPFDSDRSAGGAALAQGKPPSLGEAAVVYDEILEHELNGGPLDLAILGVGEDGHICSLFPGHKALLEDDLRVVAVEDSPKPPARRLSLTMRYVLQTKKIWVIAIGPRKLPVLRAAINKTSSSTPLDLVMRQAKDVTVFTDQTIRS